MMDRLESFDSSDLMEFITPPKIKLIGSGGAGNNILDRLYSTRIDGVETIALNTDANHLSKCKAHSRKVLGAKITQGRGTGGDPHLGKRCAEDDEASLREKIDDADMVFVIAGMGGGTGTGSAPVVAKYAMETEALVIGVAVLPFKEEGLPRRKIALQGLSELKKNCHCVIELDNENLNELTNGDCPMKRAFDVMSDLVTRTVRSLSEVITEPSTINVDFADLRKIIETGGNAKVLYGESDNSDPGSVLDSLLGNPLLGTHYQGAEAVMLHITAKSEFSLNNCHEVLAALKLELSEDVNLIWGLRTDDSMDANVKVVMLVAAIPDSNLDVEKKSEEMIPLLGESVQMIN
ncbi:MAG TPA: cell division protein FtsZ [Candidatus Poseidoniia archaeon]|nr:cell division protein FtsZ [Candidatus Poseidoniia archaeon]